MSAPENTSNNVSEIDCVKSAGANAGVVAAVGANMDAATAADANTGTKADARASTGSDAISSLPVEVFGNFRARAVGGGQLQGSKLFRSCELTDITAQEAMFLVNSLGIASIYDIRNQWEVAAHPEPYLLGAKTVALEPSTESRRKDSSSRLTAGVIGEYGKPEERMQRNYRRYMREYPLIGTALRSIAAEGVSALVHCVNGKDRTGVLCAVLLRVTGAHPDDIMTDYLTTNAINAQRIAHDVEELSCNMTSYEQAILMSFLEARPSYLHAFFDEVNHEYGSFARYARDGLRITPAQCEQLALLLDL